MKKHYFSSLILSLAIVSTCYSQHAFLEQDVIDAFITSDANDLLPIMVEMDDMVNIKSLNESFKTDKVPVNERAQIVMEKLKAKANATQPEVISFIESSGMQYENIQQLWISNIISLKASPELITNLANLESVGRIALDMPQFGLDKPKKGKASGEKSVGGVEPGIVAIGSPEMWAMGYTGQSRLALTFDTGCWPDHPAFKNRYLVNRMPLESTWFGYDSPVPIDKSDGHGTHVSGTILGLDTATADTIGSAWNAYLIVTDPIVQNLADVKSLSEILLGYEWAMNPDGDETTSSDIPDVINNSWGRDNSVIDQDWTTCPELFAPTMEAVEAAGIANVFSAGNEGPNPETIGVPHNLNAGLVNSFTVAAVNGNSATFPIASFSSRGPSLCGGEGSLLIKPEVSAPGVNVRSSVGGGQYDVYSGTSMASPHVCGAVLLLKEAFPYLSGEDILLALYYSATDLGAPGEDNTYGMGMINVKAAYDYLSENNEPVPPAVHNTDLELVSILSPSEPLACVNPIEATDINPVVVVQNNGQNEITGIEIHYTINGVNETTYTDPDLVMASGSHTEIALPQIAPDDQSSNQELHVWITPLDDEYDKFNNHNVFRFKILPVVDLLPNFTEDFENGINQDIWTLQNTDGYITWDTLSTLQPDESEGISAWMDFHTYNPIGSQHDDLITPFLYWEPTDGSFTSINLSFDLFYRKRGNNDYTKDTLAIFVKQDCGNFEGSYFEVFRQGGDSLYTVLDGNSNSLAQNSAEWRNVNLTVPIVGDNSNPYFYFKFQAINRRGNNLLLDNINISLDTDVGIAERKTPEVKLYPNPTSNSFTLFSKGIENAKSMDIFDVFGRKISEIKIHSTSKFDVSSLAQGIYLVRVNWNDGMTSAVPLVIQ